MRITVLGAGYVGLVTGVGLATLGHTVTLVEPDRRRYDRLAKGEPPFYEPGLADRLDEARRSGRLSVELQADEATMDAQLIMICVGTPLRPDGDADLSQVEEACAAIAEHAPHVPIAVRSTLPLGTTALAADWLSRPDLTSVVTNPEFLRQGSALRDFASPTRIVIGTADARRTPAAEALIAAYTGIEAPLLITSFNSAEMIKNAANAFLATKLSFVNEIADLCESNDADIEQVIEGIGLDPRIGSTYLRPGIGFGGSCLPKELANMVRVGRRQGMTMSLLAGAAETNERRATRVVDRIEERFGGVHGCRVALLGLAFKAGTDDLRYSPAIAIARTLTDRGATIAAHDPEVALDADLGVAGIRRETLVAAAVDGSDLTVLATEWPTYRELDWEVLARNARRPALFDGRNLLDATVLHASGWQLLRVGHAG